MGAWQVCLKEEKKKKRRSWHMKIDSMDPEDYRLKLAVIRELKALRINVGKLCRKDTKVRRLAARV